MPVCSVIWIVCVHLARPPRLPLFGRDGWQRAPVAEAQRGHGAGRGQGDVWCRFRCHQVQLGQLCLAASDVPPGDGLRCVLAVQKQALVGGCIESSLLWQGFLPPWKLYSRSLRASALCVCPSAVCRSGPAARFGPGMCAGHSSLDSPRCWRAGGKTPLFFPPVCKQTVRG